MIKNVVFDIGNVLVHFRWRELMEDLGLPKELQEVFDKTVFGSHWWGELDRGLREEAEIVERLREDNAKYCKEFDLIWENRDKLVIPYDYSVSWIEQLKQHGYGVYLLSNYPKEIFTLHAECGCFPFLDKVNGKMVSGFVQMVKPNMDIYEYLLREYDLATSECVFIDDREENIEVARTIGMKGIVFKSYVQATAELEGLLKVKD